MYVCLYMRTPMYMHMCLYVHVPARCMQTHTTHTQSFVTLKTSCQRRPVVLKEGGSEMTGRHGQRCQGWQTPYYAAQAVCYIAAQWVVAYVQHLQQLHRTTPT